MKELDQIVSSNWIFASIKRYLCLRKGHLDLGITLSQNDQNLIWFTFVRFWYPPPSRERSKLYKNSTLCDFIVSQPPVVSGIYWLNSARQYSIDLNVFHVPRNTNGIYYLKERNCLRDKFSRFS